MITTSSVEDDDNNIYCPYCYTLSNAYFLFNGRSYYHCPSCDLIHLLKKKDINTVITYYRNCYFDDKGKDQIAGHRTNLYRHILAVINGFRKPGYLLDLGCGCGFFLKEAKEHVWQVLGVDPSRKSIEHAKLMIGDNGVICGTLDDVPASRQFDAITLINVLDHMVDAYRQLQRVKDLLAPGGIIYLRFLNGLFHSFMMRLFNIFSAGQFISPFLIFHEYALTPKAIKRFLGDMGYADIRVLNAHITGGNFYCRDGTLDTLVQNILRSLIWFFFKILEKLSCEQWLWGPSLQVIARKDQRGSGA